ncbi:MAG: right-handed parallel beta-helix repeat-containing protein [Phycisphaerae bacterium]|nr:right-handed parallel beta-helix repeat-containing protein [Phycisphaerae bacterium]
MGRPSHRSPVLCAISVAGLCAIAAAGDLNPPAGPIAPTQRTHIGTLPFDINQPGSYVVTRDLTGTAGAAGIRINADDVAIDLNGFTLRGVPGTLDGVATIGTRRNVAVRNGTITGWGQDGVDLSTATQCDVSDLRISANAGSGVRIGSSSGVADCNIQNGVNGIDGAAASDCRITDCAVRQTSGRGLLLGASANVRGCNVSFAGNVGIEIGTGGMVRDCVVTGCVLSGIMTLANSTVIACTSTTNGEHGISCASYCNVRDCAAQQNLSTGVSASNGSVVRDCSATQNVTGIGLGSGCTVVGCSAFGNSDRGILAAIGCTVSQCSAYFNGMSGAAANKDGIFTGISATVTQCTAYDNGDDGIVVGAGSTIVDCSSNGNDGDGIQVPNDCRVVRCTADSNGLGEFLGAAIHVTGSDNRIEGCNVTDTIIGLDVDGAGNVIVGNTASGNTTNYDIVAGNSAGPITNVAGAAITTSNPWENFEY